MIYLKVFLIPFITITCALNLFVESCPDCSRITARNGHQFSANSMCGNPRRKRAVSGNGSWPVSVLSAPSANRKRRRAAPPPSRSPASTRGGAELIDPEQRQYEQIRIRTQVFLTTRLIHRLFCFWNTKRKSLLLVTR